MMPIKTFIKSHPLLSYYALAFAISWGGILIVVGGPSGIPATPEQVETLFPFALLAMFAAPHRRHRADRPPLWEGGPA
jgi:uncharacterized protein